MGNPVSLYDLEAMAKTVMSHNVWDFLAGGAADEVTLERNTSAFREISINPRYLADLNKTKRNLSTTVLGKEIGIPTVFNILGPLTNPAGAKRQLIGVSDKHKGALIANVLKKLGSERAVVVYGEDGLDEISTAASTNIAELKEGEIEEYSISPSDFGLKTLSIDELRVDSPEESLQLAMKALNGENEAASQMIAMTSGAALYVAGLVKELRQGVELSLESISNGKGLEKLEHLRKFSQSLSK